MGSPRLQWFSVAMYVRQRAKSFQENPEKFKKFSDRWNCQNCQRIQIEAESCAKTKDLFGARLSIFNLWQFRHFWQFYSFLS